MGSKSTTQIDIQMIDWKASLKMYGTRTHGTHWHTVGLVGSSGGQPWLGSLPSFLRSGLPNPSSSSSLRSGSTKDYSLPHKLSSSNSKLSGTSKWVTIWRLKKFGGSLEFTSSHSFSPSSSSSTSFWTQSCTCFPPKLKTGVRSTKASAKTTTFWIWLKCEHKNT